MAGALALAVLAGVAAGRDEGTGRGAPLRVPAPAPAPVPDEDPTEKPVPKEEAANPDVERARALMQEAEGRANERKYDEAIERLEAALGILRRARGEHAETAAALWLLGSILNDASRPEQALSAHEEALAMRRRLFPGDHADVATSLGGVAGALSTLGRPAEALPFDEQAAAMRRRLAAGDDPELATSLNGLALTLHDLGRFAEALSLEHEALAMVRRLFPGDHPRVADLVGNVAYTLDAMGRPAESRPLHEEALGIYRRRFPGDHPEVARHIGNLAHALVLAGRADDALPLHEEALAMRRRLFPGDHPDVAVNLNNLAFALDALGRPSESAPIYEEVVAMMGRLIPGDHPYVAGSLTNLANALNALGRPADALPVHEEALAIYRRLLPASHPLVATSLGNLAHTLNALGRPEAALPLDEEALAMWRRLFPGDHPGVATSQNNVARTLHALGRSADALPLQKEALAMQRRIFPGDHALVALGTSNLAHALGGLGRPADALPLEEDALGMRRRLFPGDHPDVAQGLYRLGAWHSALGHDADAINLWREAVAMDERIGGAQRHQPLTALGRALLRHGKCAEAVETLQRALDHVERLRVAARGLGTEERVRYVQEVRRSDAFPTMVRAHIALGRRLDALAFLERGRGVDMRSLLESGRGDPLAVAEERARAGGDGDALARLSATRAAVRAAEAEVVLKERTETGARNSKDVDAVRAAMAAASKARRALLDANAAEARLLRDALPETKPATVEEMRALLGASERMVFYQFDADGGLALLLSPAPADGKESPEAAVRVFPLVEGEVPLTAARLGKWIPEVVGTLAMPGSADFKALGDLFRALVPPALWEEIHGAGTLYVVGHDASNALPFEALAVGSRDGQPVLWLDEGPPVAYVASGSVLKFMRERRDAQRAEGVPSLLAVGDPAFGATDTAWPEKGLVVTEVVADGQAATLGIRPGDVLVKYGEAELGEVAALRSAAAEGGTLLVRRGAETLTVKAAPGSLGVRLDSEPPPVAGPALLDRGPLARMFRGAADRTKALKPLPGTRVEVNAIRSAFTAAKGTATVLLGREATEARLFDAAGAGPTYLHLATHGVADETETASFSFLALTMPQVPVPGDDGALTLLDLLGRWGRRLENTGMVVLSACDTQKGRIQRNEGIFAMPWGFQFAGCPTVVATLWKVSDATTPGLMEDFYRRVLAKGGAGRLEALVAAKRALRKTHPDPFHWAPFVLLGDPR